MSNSKTLRGEHIRTPLRRATGKSKFFSWGSELFRCFLLLTNVLVCFFLGVQTDRKVPVSFGKLIDPRRCQCRILAELCFFFPAKMKCMANIQTENQHHFSAIHSYSRTLVSLHYISPFLSSTEIHLL